MLAYTREVCLVRVGDDGEYFPSCSQRIFKDCLAKMEDASDARYLDALIDADESDVIYAIEIACKWAGLA